MERWEISDKWKAYWIYIYVIYDMIRLNRIVGLLTMGNKWIQDYIKYGIIFYY